MRALSLSFTDAATRHAAMPWLRIPEPPALIGSEWVRREDTSDRVKVVGVFDCGERGLELVTTPVDFGPTESWTADAFADEFTRAENAAAIESARALQDRLSRIGVAR